MQRNRALLLTFGLFAFLPQKNLVYAANAKRVFTKVEPYVYKVKTAVRGDAPKSSYGTGFVVDEKGLLVTNYHVVSDVLQEGNKYKIFVVVDDAPLRATILKVDIIHDLALLKIDHVFKGHLQLANSPPFQGERLYSIGIPEDLNMSIVEGTYNGVVGYADYQEIHMSTPINAGMSGGPTIDAHGRVIGVNVAVLLSSQNISFAVPVAQVHLLLSGETAVKDFHESIRLQINKIQDTLTAEILKEPAKNLDLPGWKVRAPGSFLKCWSSNQDHDKHLYRSFKHSCFLDHAAFLSDETYVGSLEMGYQTLEAENFQQPRFFRLISDKYNGESNFLNDFVTESDGRSRTLTQYDCSESLIMNIHKLPMRTNICMRALVKYPGLFNIDFKFTTLTKTREAVLFKSRFLAFTLENVKRIMATMINSVQAEAVP